MIVKYGWNVSQSAEMCCSEQRSVEQRLHLGGSSYIFWGKGGFVVAFLPTTYNLTSSTKRRAGSNKDGPMAVGDWWCSGGEQDFRPFSKSLENHLFIRNLLICQLYDDSDALFSLPHRIALPGYHLVDVKWAAVWASRIFEKKIVREDLFYIFVTLNTEYIN